MLFQSIDIVDTFLFGCSYYRLFICYDTG